MLSPSQTIATCQPNISQHCWAQHVACVWPPCCDMLRGVGCCWLKFDHFQTWANNTQHVATHRNTLAKRMQHVAPNNVAICWVGMLQSFGRGLRRSTLTHFLNYNNTKLYIVQIFSCFPSGTILLRSKAICSKRMCRLIIVNYIMHNYTRTLTLFLVVEHNV